MSCSGQKGGLALNHSPLVVAVIGDYIPIPEERNATGEGDASLLHLAQDAPPDILGFFSENIIEDVFQRLPLKAGGSAIAEMFVDLRKGLDKFGRAELVRQFEQHCVIRGDGVVIVDDGHSGPFPLLSQGRLLFYYICC